MRTLLWLTLQSRHITFLPPLHWPFLWLSQEAYIADLDAKSGASLKLTLLNPRGRIWTMVAGGGASVVYRWLVKVQEQDQTTPSKAWINKMPAHMHLNPTGCFLLVALSVHFILIIMIALSLIGFSIRRVCQWCGRETDGGAAQTLPVQLPAKFNS